MSAKTPTPPIPLELEDDGLALSHQGAILGRLYDASSFPCCEDDEKYDGEQRALAAFIVLACNSHAALVLLLESARYYVVKAGTTGAFELRDRIDAALKGAKP